MMAKAIERTYATTFSEEEITMDKYNELLLDIARLIADTNRENFLLRSDLERTKQALATAEGQLEDVVATAAVEMMRNEEGKRGA